MNFLLFTNLFIALAAGLMTLQTQVLLGETPRVDALVATVFFGTLAVYNLDRLVGSRREDRVDSTRRHRWVRRHRRLLVMTMAAAGVGLAVSLPALPMRVVGALLPLAVMCGAYSLPVLRPLPVPFDRLKEIAGLKVFLIAGVWAMATAWLPAVESGALAADGASVLLVVLRRFVFVAAIALPFDVRDLSRDAAAGIRTIPMVLGTSGTRRLSLAMLLLFAGLSAIRLGMDSGDQAALLMSVGPTAAALLALSPHRGDLYYSLLLDGTMVMQSVLVLAM